ncbi:MAG: P-loop NTPase [Candidatus Methanoperedens sp.]|nr:P-loop NTPase [Candidatus Methanoperedens sp.]
MLILFYDIFQDTMSRLTFLYFVFLLVYRIDARIPLASVLLFLFGFAIILVAGNKALAYDLSIYALYFLIVGILLKSTEYIRAKREKIDGNEIKDITPVKEGKQIIPTKKEGQRFLAIVSGKGGVGKTTIAANLGTALSQLDNKVIMMDMDLAMPNLEIITGLKNPPVGLIDVLEGRLELARVTYIGRSGISVIPPGVMLEGYSNENVYKINKLLNEFPLKSDFVILDMPPGREAVEIFSSKIEALLVVNPDKAAVLDAVNMKVLLEKKGVNILGTVINRGSKKDTGWIDEVENALEIPVIAIIPENNIVKRSLDREECFVDADADSPPSREMMHLARKIEQKTN